MTADVLPQYAGFWRRTSALGIDFFLFTLIVGAVQTLINGWPDLSRALEAQRITLFSFPKVVEQAVLLALTITLWMRFLGTPGKLLLSCHVVDADSGRPMSLKQAVLRYVAYVVSVLPLLLGLLWVAWDTRKQGFHDKIAGTVVVIDDGVLALDDESAKSLDQLMEEAR